VRSLIETTNNLGRQQKNTGK